MNEPSVIRRGLTEALKLLRKPSGQPDLVDREIRTRAQAASDYLHRRERTLRACDSQAGGYDTVLDGLTHALRLLDAPTDQPDLDRGEIRTRLIDASEYLRLREHTLAAA